MPDGLTFLDRWLRRHRYREIHALHVRADAWRVMEALRGVTVREIAFARMLFALRALPAILSGRRGQAISAHRGALEMMQTMGFVLLESSESAMALGVVGRFWLWTRGGDIRPLASPEEFLSCRAPGCAKAAIGFVLSEARGGTLLQTETRIEPLDARAEARFRIYWRLIRPFSGLLRIAWLRAVRRRAEAPR